MRPLDSCVHQPRGGGLAAALDELKVRARVRLNATRREQPDAQDRLRDRLIDVAREAGFRDWEHARRVLGGLAQPGEDVGTFWYSPRTITLLNEWFANHDEARQRLGAERAAYLLPYRRQFMVVAEPFVRELGLDPHDPAWDEAGRDLVGAYGSRAWQALAAARVRAPQSSFEGG